MFELKNCCTVPFPEKLSEQYEVKKHAIYANINTSKVQKMMERFIKEHNNEPLFFILEIPTKLDDETKYGKWIADYFHKDVYFIDGLSTDKALQILSELAPLLVDDGMNSFGFGGHLSHEEILFGRYNVMTIYTQKADKYITFLSDFSIEKTDELITAHNTFSKENYGETWVCKDYDFTIYDIPEKYIESGMYFYERRNKD